jgi:hypothetical protein
MPMIEILPAKSAADRPVKDRLRELCLLVCESNIGITWLRRVLCLHDEISQVLSVLEPKNTTSFTNRLESRHVILVA